MAGATDDNGKAAAEAAAALEAQMLLREALRNTGPGSLGLIHDVLLPVNVDLGRARISIREILHMEPGSVVELEKPSGEAVDICIGNELLAQGEVIVFQDKLRIRVLDLVYPPERAPEEAENE